MPWIVDLENYSPDMQRKQQVGECWVYVIFFAWSLTLSSSSLHAHIMMSDFAVLGIGFFGPWFSNSGIGIRVSEVGLNLILYCIHFI